MAREEGELVLARVKEWRRLEATGIKKKLINPISDRIDLKTDGIDPETDI